MIQHNLYPNKYMYDVKQHSISYNDVAQRSAAEHNIKQLSIKCTVSLHHQLQLNWLQYVYMTRVIGMFKHVYIYNSLQRWSNF